MPYFESENCIKPNLDTVIWRYIDLTKFEKMLQDNALFFCRADRFSDPFEGSVPRREYEYRINERISLAKGAGKDVTEQEAIEFVEGISHVHRMFKKKYIINCWHINNHENDSMWQLYLKTNEGVAIRSTVGNLLSSLENTVEKIMCSKVRYIDYDNGIWYDKNEYPVTHYNLFRPLIHKRIEFEQEAEIRLLHELDTDGHEELDQFWDSRMGLNICVNLNNLVDEIFLPPTCTDNLQIRIEQMIKYYGYSFTVIRSSLARQPYY